MNGTLLTPQQLLSASSNVSGLARGRMSTVNASTTAADLPSQTAYVLVLAARDAAPVPNYMLQATQLQLTAPDVTPPTFTGVRWPDLAAALYVVVGFVVMVAFPWVRQQPDVLAAWHW
eukprot:GHRQ01025518.1.p1 GENE.GHRQ01025518.1~~GHRQ01025518.1.p1  ORF type:complete len:118 (+),score=36.36 GHRQ01025518.1:526-879(+)